MNKQELESYWKEKSARARKIKSETDLKSATIDVLSARGFWCWTINAGQILLRGRSVQLMPPGSGDIQGILPPGRVFFLEAKLPGQKQNANEIEWQAKCEAHFVDYAVFHTIDEAVGIVEGWANGSR